MQTYSVAPASGPEAVASQPAQSPTEPRAEHGAQAIRRPFSFAYLTLAVASTLATLSAVPAHAQYYGGVVLNQAGSGGASLQLTGAASAADLANVSQLTRGLVLSSEPSLGMRFGYRLSPNFSVEAQYVDKAGLTTDSALRLDAVNGRERALGLNLVGTLPLLKNFSVDGRAGFRNESFSAGAIDTAGTHFGSTTQRTISSGLLGVGLQYNFNRSLGLRFDVERNRRFFSDRQSQDSDNVSFGVVWRF
jgi:hypothetical protein